MRLFGMVILLAAATPVLAAPENSVEAARVQVEALDFKSAAKTLDKSLAEYDYSRADVLAYFELRGVVAATLGDVRGARDAFRALLALDPRATLKRHYAPRVMTPFYEAKSWVEEKGGLALERSAPRIEGGQVKALGLSVRDPAGLVTAVRVHLLEDGGNWREVALPREGGEVACDGPGVRVWIEVLAARDWLVVAVGSASEPLRLTATGERPTLLPEPPPPPPFGVAPPIVRTVASEPRFRPAAYALAGVGAGALLAGAAFGFVASGERQRFAAAERAGDGGITGLTRQQALELDAAVRTHAVAANVLFAAGGVLAASGAGLWIAGTLSPAPGGGAGVAVGGSFP